jgi:protein-tyrosine kinase
MEQIRRALAKARGEGPTDLRPVEENLSRGQPGHYSPLFDPGAQKSSLNPRTLEANRIVAWNKRDPRTTAFDILRTKVLKAMKERGWSTLAITSPTQDCGKTTVAVNLAFSMAYQMPSDVVLVDFDLRQPQIATYLGIEPRGDLSAFLEGNGPLTTHLVVAGGVQLRVAPNLGIRRNATELLLSPRVDQFFSDLHRERSGRVGIFDLPPILAGDDALAVLPRVDCAIVVLGEGVTTKSDLKETLMLMNSSNTLGVVVNKSQAPMKSYY